MQGSADRTPAGAYAAGPYREAAMKDTLGVETSYRRTRTGILLMLISFILGMVVAVLSIPTR